MVIGENLAMDNASGSNWLPVSEVDAEYEMNAGGDPMKDELFWRGEKVPMTKSSGLAAGAGQT